MTASAKKKPQLSVAVDNTSATLSRANSYLGALLLDPKLEANLAVDDFSITSDRTIYRRILSAKRDNSVYVSDNLRYRHVSR
jgi:hypothetical protein